MTKYLFQCALSAVLICAPLHAQSPAPPPVPMPAPEPAENQAFFGGHIQRSMTLLATSSKERRWPVRVLMYGQSIVGSSTFTRMMEAFLRERFPYADITLENRAIGGFEAPRLVRTAVHDLYPFYPDLLIFHVYGGEKTGELERIIVNTRRYTTADIVLFNHHQNRDQTFVPEFGAKFFRYLAEKYGCEIVDVSTDWPEYLKTNHLEPGQILRDNVHPNVDGLALLTTLIGRHLRYNPLFAPASWETVRRFEAKRQLDEGASDEIVFSGTPWKLEDEGAVGNSSRGVLKLRFDGNRVDAIAAHVKDLSSIGTARVLIDGKPPSTDPRVYAVTLPSKGPQTWFPAIRRIDFEKLPLLEDWTLRITETNADATKLRFEVSGSKTGPDGAGSNTERFVSKSGRVVIDPRDWMLSLIMTIFKQKDAPPVGYEIHWSIKPMFADTYQPQVAADPAKVYATTLAQGLVNGPHTLEIIPNGDGPVPVEAIQVYRPPLR
jgi:hypothetical protein